MAEDSPTPKGAFHARLRHVSGVYRAEYSGEVNPDDPDDREMLDFHIGTDAEGVRMWVEEMARSLGYPTVTWDELPEQS